ncbi:MAG: hypothetical protein ABI321_06035 [Polyangia bacterium]
MRALLIVSLVILAVAPARAFDRTVVREHQTERARLRARLHAASGPQEHVTGPLYHQVQGAGAREALVTELAATGTTHKMLAGWIPRGGYPGIWTVEDADGFFRGAASKPFELRIKAGSVLFDNDLPEHRAVYEEWKTLDAKTRGPQARNRFDEMKSVDGRSLSTRVGGVHAPSHERFYKEMGIAGVGWWHDAYGQRSVIVLNPAAIESVTPLK